MADKITNGRTDGRNDGMTICNSSSGRFTEPLPDNQNLPDNEENNKCAYSMLLSCIRYVEKIDHRCDR